MSEQEMRKKIKPQTLLYQIYGFYSTLQIL